MQVSVYNVPLFFTLSSELVFSFDSLLPVAAEFVSFVRINSEGWSPKNSEGTHPIFFALPSLSSFSTSLQPDGWTSNILSISDFLMLSFFGSEAGAVKSAFA